jgi:hypothetical protein
MQIEQTNRKKGKSSLFSIFSIIAIFIICAAAWQFLSVAKSIYLKTIDSKSKQMPAKKEHKPLYGQKNLMTRLIAMYYLTQINFKDTKNKASIKENELKAAQLLKKYAKAQQKYKNHYGYYANDASELIIEESGKLNIIDEHLKPLNSATNTKSPFYGYFYIEIVKKGLNGHASSFFLSAIPAEYGVSATKTLCIDETAQIRQKDTHGEPVFDIRIINDTWEKF